VDQTKEVMNSGENYEVKKKEFNKLFNSLCTIFSSSELHTKKDINEAIQAFKLLIFS